MSAVDAGYVQREIQEAAYRTQRAIEQNDQIVVGVNRFHTGEMPTGDLLRVDESVRTDQIARLQTVRSDRDERHVRDLLVRIEQAALDQDVALMPLFVEAVEAYATLGEICDAMRRVFGEYLPENWV